MAEPDNGCPLIKQWELENCFFVIDSNDLPFLLRLFLLDRILFHVMKLIEFFMRRVNGQTN